MRAQVLVLALALNGSTLTAPHWQETFGSAAACSAAATAWQGQVRDGARWVNEQYRVALTGFWLKAVHRAAGQVETARAARCVARWTP